MNDNDSDGEKLSRCKKIVRSTMHTFHEQNTKEASRSKNYNNLLLLTVNNNNNNAENNNRHRTDDVIPLTTTSMSQRLTVRRIDSLTHSLAFTGALTTRLQVEIN